jgi:hypothetical protein
MADSQQPVYPQLPANPLLGSDVDDLDMTAAYRYDRLRISSPTPQWLAQLTKRPTSLPSTHSFSTNSSHCHRQDGLRQLASTG